MAYVTEHPSAQIVQPNQIHAAPTELGCATGRAGCYKHGAPTELYQQGSSKVCDFNGLPRTP